MWINLPGIKVLKIIARHSLLLFVRSEGQEAYLVNHSLLIAFIQVLFIFNFILVQTAKKWFSLPATQISDCLWDTLVDCVCWLLVCVKNKKWHETILLWMFFWTSFIFNSELVSKKIPAILQAHIPPWLSKLELSVSHFLIFFFYLFLFLIFLLTFAFFQFRTMETVFLC